MAIRALRENGRIVPMDSIGCAAAVITATCEELVDWMGAGVSRGELSFPEANGPIRWVNGTLVEALQPDSELMQRAA